MSDTPDWAEQKAVELLPCDYKPYMSNNLCSPDKHFRLCAVNFRPAVAEALRAAKQAGAVEARVLVICPDCERNQHCHTDAQVGHLICDCGCWWPLKQRAY